MNKNIHDEITRVRGSFEKTMSNIKLLKKYNIPVKIKTPLMEQNKYEYREVYNFCKINDFKFMSSPSIFSKSNGDDSPHKLEIKDNLTEIVQETDYLMETMKKISPVSLNKKYSCTAPFDSLSVQPDGKVYACNTLFYELGNVLNSTLKEIWNGDNIQKLRKLCEYDRSECIKCFLAKKCKRCPGLSLLENNDILKCSSTAKRLALCRKNDK